MSDIERYSPGQVVLITAPEQYRVEWSYNKVLTIPANGPLRSGNLRDTLNSPEFSTKIETLS